MRNEAKEHKSKYFEDKVILWQNGKYQSSKYYDFILTITNLFSKLYHFILKYSNFFLVISVITTLSWNIMTLLLKYFHFSHNIRYYDLFLEYYWFFFPPQKHYDFIVEISWPFSHIIYYDFFGNVMNLFLKHCGFFVFVFSQNIVTLFLNSCIFIFLTLALKPCHGFNWLANTVILFDYLKMSDRGIPILSMHF